MLTVNLKRELKDVPIDAPMSTLINIHNTAILRDDMIIIIFVVKSNFLYHDRTIIVRDQSAGTAIL